MNKKRVALALAAALGINTLMVTVGQVGEQITVAHAQNARLTGDQVKLLDGIKIKYLDTEVNVLDNGDAELSFSNITASDIKNVTGTFGHSVFDERQGIDSSNANVIISSWDSTKGKAVVKGLQEPGIYTGDVTIEYNDGTKETYKVSLKKTPTSDVLTFDTQVTPGGIKVTNVKFNQNKDLGSHVNLPDTLIMQTVDGKYKTELKYDATNGVVFSALDLTSDGKLKKDQVYQLVYKYGQGEHEIVVDVVLYEVNTEVLKAYASNSANFISDLEADLSSNFGASALIKIDPADTTGNSISTKSYGISVDGNKLTDYVQTYSSTKVGGAVVTPTTVNGSEVVLEITAPTTVLTEDNFVENVSISYGINGTFNSTVSNGLFGQYYLQESGGSKHVYFDVSSQNGMSAEIADSAATHSVAYLKIDPGLQSAVGVDFGKEKYSIVTPFEHGYNTIDLTFGVDSDFQLNDWKTKLEDKAKNATGAATAVVYPDVSGATSSNVKTSVIVVVDELEATTAQVTFEKVSVSEGKVTLKGGNKLRGTVDINNVNFTVDGIKASVIASESTGDDIVFFVQFNGQVPSTAKWIFDANGIKLNGVLNTSVGSVEAVNLTKVAATNNGTDNLRDYFKLEATFSTNVSSGTIKVDGGSDRVDINKFDSGSHYVSNVVSNGKYRGTYSVGIIVSKQPFTIEAKDAKSVSNTSASLVIDANFIDKNDIDKVTGGIIQYSEKTVNGNTTTWSEWKDSPTKVEKSEVKEDAITKTVTGLTGGKTYKFRVVYDYNNGTKTEKVYSNETTEVTLPTSSSSSTITGSGGTTTGTSTGSTTITVTTSNSTLTGTSASVTLPSGFRYDSGKTPVAVTFKYKDKDGKIVTETKEQYSNVTAKFNGNNVELNGLVPGKDYNEITVDYTDNNGKTRSIILKNVKTTSQTQVETYLANVYEVVFGRPADEAGYHFHLDNLKNKKVSLRDFLLNMLNEKEFVEKYKSTEEKIEALYNAIVNRTSDEAGKKFWVDEYKKVLAVYGSETTALKAIADRMVNENELKELADKMGVQW